jgi:nitroreductase
MTSVSEFRKAEHEIDPIFIERWSARAFDPVADVPQAILDSAFEAARWAPSSNNAQPWRFIYARRGTAEWQALFDSTLDRTHAWLKNAAVIVYVVSKTTRMFDDKVVPSPTHAFDAGSAFENFLLQISKSGYSAHALASFDHDKARAALELPDDYAAFCAIGIGKRADKSILPPFFAEREFPSDRLPVSVIAMEGKFRAG